MRAWGIILIIIGNGIPCSWAGEVDPKLVKMFAHYQADEGEIEFYGGTASRQRVINRGRIRLRGPTAGVALPGTAGSQGAEKGPETAAKRRGAGGRTIPSFEG